MADGFLKCKNVLNLSFVLVFNQVLVLVVRDIKLQVMVIDDNQDDVMFFQRAAEKVVTNNKFEIISFSEASIAFAALTDSLNRPPCVIFLDYNLEGSSAAETYIAQGMTKETMAAIRRSQLTSINFVRRVREHPRLSNIPIVMFTSSNLCDDVSLAWDSGVNSFVVKDVRRLIEDMESLLAYWVDFNVDQHGGR